MESDSYDFGWPTLSGDVTEARQMQQFAPAGMPWWQAVIQYGATRAIDNRFGPPVLSGNQDPGSFGGQNGRTYQNQPTANGGRPVTADRAAGSPDITWLVVAAAAVYLLARA
jgi:hypothetical protein